MSNIRAINQLSQAVMSQQQAVTQQAGRWQVATTSQRRLALQREQLIKPLAEKMATGVSAATAIDGLLTAIRLGMAAPAVCQLASQLANRGKPAPGRSTLYNWLADYQAHGVEGLLDKHTGRRRQDYGWEHLALQLYHIASKPSMGAVARKLREQYGHATATDSRVARYLKSMPAQLGDASPMRLGNKLYNNSQKHYIHRTTENVPVGALYQGDGHTLDVYLQHPVTGKPWRAELVAWMDIRSRYIVGWAISNAESAISTIQALSRSLVLHDHVPAIVYVDNGSGYKSKMMCAENTGFYERMGIEPIFAIPGNAKAKGNIERWFRTMERDLNIWWPDAFCGEGMGRDEQARLFNLAMQGKVQLPTLAEWCQAFADWLDNYHARPHPELPATTPAALWQQLQATPVNMTELELNRPQITRTVQRGYITLHSRKYKHAALLAYNGATVHCEYDLHCDELITVRDAQGRLLCDATLVKRADYIPASRIEQARDKSLAAAVKRLDKKKAEKIARTAAVIEHTANLDALEGFDELLTQQKEETITIDLLDDGYLD